ncbi:YbhB/YbcL family Raf kinase inhibitor-like protein [Noviherbaspirillum aerium]|uniref:YbhB/YbcL family Raf kinase inhibitor-like protein n=1 Tax=Noviherbaspirillum aerium TaxID=2588497 RepID=UPI00124E583F|nr:YbhB/YbcL family Raf kinase inhibitor-like protein [Noviherbaspirillum aerium]
MLEKLPSVIGQALQDRRAGLDSIAFNLIDLRNGTAAISVSSLAFGDHEAIPEQYTADGVGTSPPLEWTGVPDGTGSLLLMVEDADAPTPHPLVHAIVASLPPKDGNIGEGALGDDGLDGDIGRNSYLRTGWLPPDPPPGHGVHRYAFQVFALDSEAVLPGTPGREAALRAIEEHAIASGCLIGTYERPDGSIKIPASTAVGVVGPTQTPGT